MSLHLRMKALRTSISSGVVADHVVVIGGDLIMQALGGMREKSFCAYEPCSVGPVRPDRRTGLVEPRRAVGNEELGPLQPALDEIVEDGAPSFGALPPMLLIASSTFWPSARTPRTTSNEIEVALRSSRTRAKVLSRSRRTIGALASERGSGHASRSSLCATSGSPSSLIVSSSLAAIRRSFGPTSWHERNLPRL